MCYVGVLFYCVDLIFVDETLDVGALFDESSAQEVYIARLQGDQYVEDHDYKKVSLVRTLSSCTVQCCHEFVHETMDEDKLEYWARLVTNFTKLSDQFAEE